MRTQIANVFWSGAEAAVSAVLSFASAFIVARLIGPTEVGIGAAVVAVHVLLWVAVNALFADALVQRSALDSSTFSSAFFASITVGCVAALIQAGAGPPLHWLLADHRLITMSLLLAAPLPLVGAAGPVQGLLTRDRAYKALALRTVAGQGLGTLVGVVAALRGAGAWALVGQQFVTSAVGALALLINCPSRPEPRISWSCLRELLRIGLPLTESTLVLHGRYRLFALLIGGTAGAAALGQVHMAFRLIDAMRDLAFTAQWRLMLPILSERQDDLSGLHDAMHRCLGWSSLFAFPLCAGLAVSIQPLVAVLLGPVWQPSGVAALPLIALAAWLFLNFPAGVAVVARGERCMYLGFYEGPQRLVGKAEAVSIDLADAYDDGRLMIQWQPAIELAIDELAAVALATVKQSGAKRIVIDGVEGFRDSALRTERFGLFLNALLHQLREACVTTILTEELPLYADPGHAKSVRVSALTENLVLLRYAETDTGLRRMISVVKQRESAHDTSLRELFISSQGLDVIESPLSPANVVSAQGLSATLTPRRET